MPFQDKDADEKCLEYLDELYDGESANITEADIFIKVDRVFLKKNKRSEYVKRHKVLVKRMLNT